MEFAKISDVRDPRYVESIAYYACSFPAHEQRAPRSQAAIMADAEYEFNILTDGGRAVGSLLCWDAGDFIYVEHFYIYPECRGRRLGAAALKLLARRGRPVILEIDPPVDDVATRRQAFYERCGFVTNPFPHVHPPYHAGNAGHSLVIMSWPRALSRAEYDAFNDYLTRRVMAGAQG